MTAFNKGINNKAGQTGMERYYSKSGIGARTQKHHQSQYIENIEYIDGYDDHFEVTDRKTAKRNENYLSKITNKFHPKGVIKCEHSNFPIAGNNYSKPIKKSRRGKI